MTVSSYELSLQRSGDKEKQLLKKDRKNMLVTKLSWLILALAVSRVAGESNAEADADADKVGHVVEHHHVEHHHPIEPVPYAPEPVPYEETPTYHPEPAPYHPEPVPYHPEPAPYHAEPAPYKPEPAPYHHEPAPYHPKPAPYHPPKPAPYTPQPYHPLPAPYAHAAPHAAPAPYGHQHHHRDHYYGPPRCSKNNPKTYCLDDYEYPTYDIQAAIEYHYDAVQKLYKDVIAITENSVDNLNNIDEETYLCPTETAYIQPLRAVNVHGKWRIIVNDVKAHYETLTQTARVEECTTPEEKCPLVPEPYATSCTQKKIYHRFLVYDPYDEYLPFAIESFQLPSACACFAEEYILPRDDAKKK